MKKFWLLFFFSFLIFHLSLPEYSLASMKKVAQSKMQFLKISPSARAAALGDAVTSLGGDLNSIFYNPAGMAFVKGINLIVNNNNWIADIRHLSAAFSIRPGNIGTFTFSLINMDYGRFERTVVDEHAWEGYKYLGTFSIQEYALGFGYAKRITDRLSLGGNLKYLYQNLGDIQSFAYIGTAFESNTNTTFIDNVFALDFGTFYYTGFKGIVIAMAMQNFANQPLPLIFRYGMSIELNQVFFPSFENQIVRLSGDILQSKDYGEGYQFGLEYVLYNQFFLRTGYKTVTSTEEDLSFGVGMDVSLKSFDLKVDYSYSKFGMLGNVNRVSFGISY